MLILSKTTIQLHGMMYSEGSPSGRWHRSWKPEGVHAPRGFKSHALRSYLFREVVADFIAIYAYFHLAT